jgi:hypothetical protein
MQFRPGDSPQVTGAKSAASRALAEAAVHGRAVEVTHPDDRAEITSVSLPRYDISPIGPARHNDFFAVSGQNFPANSRLEFESAASVVTVFPDVARPHWLLVAELPAAVALGRNQLRVSAPGWTSTAIPIEVSNRPRLRVRALYSGEPKANPYSIVFVANPAIEAESGGGVTPDGVLTDRAGYHAAVAACLEILLTKTEDVLRQSGRDAQLRIVSVFDETRAAATATALAHEIAPNIMETRRDRLNAFLSGYRLSSDVVYVIHGSTTHDRSSGWFTTDAGGASTAFTFDGVNRVHGHTASIPGSVAIPTSFDTTSMTPIHEFGHAAADFNNGRVIDLYVDGGISGFVINKKTRASAADPVPANFANYKGSNFASDAGRDALGYPATWMSYHPELLDNTRPNLMDNYKLAANPQQCRFDRLTYAWLSDRLGAKLRR